MSKKLKVLLLEDLLTMVDTQGLNVLDKRKKMLETVYSLGTVVDKGMFKSSMYFIVEENKK